VTDQNQPISAVTLIFGIGAESPAYSTPVPLANPGRSDAPLWIKFSSIVRKKGVRVGLAGRLRARLEITDGATAVEDMQFLILSLKSFSYRHFIKSRWPDLFVTLE